MNSNDQFFQYRLLAFKFGRGLTFGAFRELAENEAMQLSEKDKEILSGLPELRNVCAKLPVSLVDRLDETLCMLDLTKRDFIEIAITDALDKVDRFKKELDVYEFQEPAQEVAS